MKNLKIGTQLRLGFAAMLLFVIVLGVVSYLQSGKIHEQTETMYSHPLKVRRAIGSLQFNIQSIRIGERDLLLANNDQEKQDAVQLMELFVAEAFQQFNIMYELYLGPRTDIDEAYKAFINWNTSRNENTKLVLSGDIEKAKKNIFTEGRVRNYREIMMAKIKIIDDFATQKGDTLFANSSTLMNTLNNQLILLITTILWLSLFISYILLRNIRKPLSEITAAADRFHNGDMNSRSSYAHQNEFGILSDSFNNMVEHIQSNMDLDEKVVKLSGLMMSEEDAKKFFRSTLSALITHTSSQMAAVYLLSDDKKTFDHFESTGADKNARQSFLADDFEGEFGSVIASHHVQHIKSIPEDTRFVFHTVGGKFIPREIITIPIISNNEIIAIISLASVGRYSNQAIHLIDRILNTLCARVEGILAYQKNIEFLRKLEFQNMELESQKTEMETQAAELTEQNTELEMQKNQLNEANRLKTNFLSNMSHELRTPLNSVIALSGVLNRRLSKKIPDEEYSYLEVIERNGKHLLSLINDILDISRIEAGREEVEITNFDVSELISEVILMIKPQAQQKNIELVYSEADRNFSIISDIDKCRHILQNIIDNAVKFTQKGKVEVSVSLIGKRVGVAVTDTGIGIAENHLQHIFDEFRQADESTSRRFGGTGLGLAIAKKYSNLLGGTISVKSTPGSGSVFTLILPLNYTTDTTILEKPASRLNNQIKTVPIKTFSNSSKKTILLVEDSEPAIIQMKDILEVSGYQLLVARDGGEALEIIGQTIPDAMILDLMMPGIDGFEVLRTLRDAEQTAHIPVLILTAKHITKEDLKFLTRNNIHQLIRKGDVGRNELLNAVASMVFSEKVESVKTKRELQTIDGKPVILAIEDNPDNMITVKALLANNYLVIEAVDGIEGIAMAEKHKPNLILMDIALPGIDGIEAFKAIRNNGALHYIPIIALTASAMTSDRETILAHGFDSYIAKPIDEHIFFKTIRNVLYGQ